ncbi:hypothetical protein [Filimonas effusa]|uniref:Lipoprotein n=1 Tax=Filimonas effusa TaxID=2508721 RepID=A0A4Q1DAE9_9BACT|nr:hypothetical protein [Filimonas effusa]RXK85878.1 hypothetical protein ESB13_03445 [Filimonas effusa]
MRIILTVILGISFFACKTQKSSDYPAELSCNYGATTTGDSSKGTFVWQKTYQMPEKNHPVLLHWGADTSLSITYKYGTKPIHFFKVPLTEKQRKMFPDYYLNNTFHFAGVYEHEAYRGIGFYFVFYRYKNQVLVQHRQSLNFLMAVMMHLDTPENPFEKAGYLFPFKKEIRFK